MVIISATRQLTQAVFTLDASISHDEFGHAMPPNRRNLAFISVDATGSMNSDDIAEACSTMIDLAQFRMGRELGFGWHDVL